MIRLGLRLAVAGGREAISRLALITLAVAVGCALLLATLATSNAFTAQNDRYAWLETGFQGSSSDSPAAHDPAWWLLQADYFQGKLIGRVDVAATGPNPPVPPGIAALPAAGELYVSPALADLLRTTPADELRARYPGTQIGIIGADALPSPDSLLVIIGRSLADLSRAATGAELITEISTTSPGECVEVCAPGVGTDANGIVLVLSVVAAALLFPVLVFVGGATRLSAARREQRFAAMRLVGATPRQVSRLATIESTVATAIGAAIGFGLFAVLRPAVADLPFSGTRFFTSDLSLTTANVLLVAVGVPVAAAFAARVALRRVNISPLGVTRRVTPRPPRPVRLIPLAAGVMWLAYLAFVSDIRHSVSSYTQAYAYLAGVFAMMIGLVVAGPWLTMLGARLSARRATRAGGLIAARRLSDNPRAAFRAVSGVVLAVFVGTCAIGIITTITAYNAGAAGDTANATGTLVMPFFRLQDRPSDQSTSVAPDVRHDLMAIAGVEGVAAVHVDRGVRFRFLASCAEIARLPALGRCTPGAETAQIELDLGGAVIDEGEPMLADARVVTGSGRDTLTDAQGEFVLGDLPPGEHVVLIDEKTLAENTKSAGSVVVTVEAGGETAKVNFPVVPKQAQVTVKQFPSSSQKPNP